MPRTPTQPPIAYPDRQSRCGTSRVGRASTATGSRRT